MEKTLGKRIVMHRKRLGLTQEQLAERVRVSAQAVSKWENNLSCPDISVLPELADVFDISLDELLGRSSSAGCEAEPVEEPEKDDKSDYSWHWEMPMRKRHSVIFAVFASFSISETASFALMFTPRIFSPFATCARSSRWSISRSA